MWRKDELERINNTTAGPERKAALCMLLEQEATLIASIGRHKVVADVENQDKQLSQAVPLSCKYIHTHVHVYSCCFQYCMLHLSDLIDISCDHNNSSVRIHVMYVYIIL